MVVNDRGEVESFESYDNPAIRLAMLNFVDVQSAAQKEHLKNQALKMEERADTNQLGDDEDEDQEN